MKHFLIIGLGNFGMGVAKTLYDEGDDITAVDIDKNKVQEIQESSNQAILGDATDRKILEQLGVDKFDSAVISMGSDEHAAILITLHLKEMGCANTIVKAENEDHGRILQAVGANKVIFPEDEMAKKLALSLSNTNFLDFIPLGEDYTVAEIAPPKQFHGKSIMDLKLRQKYKVEIIAIKDEASTRFKYLTPPDYVFQPSDTIICIGKFEDLEKIKEAK
jgi:trk system potassium uptake protein TrkA